MKILSKLYKEYSLDVREICFFNLHEYLFRISVDFRMELYNPTAVVYKTILYTLLTHCY